MASEWHSQEKRALTEGWTPSRYLLSLCSEEATHRESERLRRYIKDARLPTGKSVSEYNFALNEVFAAADCRAYWRNSLAIAGSFPCCSRAIVTCCPSCAY